MRRPVRTSDSAAPNGPYSQGILAEGRLLMVAGQLPIDPATGELVGGEFEDQARMALQNLSGVIRAAGARLDDVVRIGVYLRDVGNSGKLSGVYQDLFSEPFPARTTIGAQLPLEAEIEVDAIVVLDV